MTAQQDFTDLFQQIASLSERCSRLGARLSEAAREFRAPLFETLVKELSVVRSDIVDLRARVLRLASSLSVLPAPSPEQAVSLKDLERLLRATVEAKERQAKMAAFEEARQRAVGLLDRVLTIAHREDPNFPSLLACHEKARELHRVILDSPSEDMDQQIAFMTEHARPFSELLALVENRDMLDDNRWILLEDAVSQSFGRPLTVAAERGKLLLPGARPARQAPASRASPSPSTAIPRPVTPPPASQPAVPADAPSTAGEFARGAGVTGPAEQPPAAAEPVVGPRKESPVAEVELPPLDPGELETVQWWLAASNAWTALKARQLSFADAVREELAKYPHLLSVPIQDSAGYDGGRLAEGYALLLEYVETQERGFVKGALARFQQFARGRSAKDYSLGRQVYDYLVAEGRLYKTYPEFVKHVLVNALPNPGVWTQARIFDADAETRVFTRANSTIGETEEQSQSVTDEKQRFVEYLFSTKLAPLTARFFSVEASDLSEPRVVEARLAENGAPSDKAWVLTLLPDGRVGGDGPRKLKLEGAVLTELLGKGDSRLWIAVFNPDPNAEKEYGLTLSLRKKIKLSAKPAQTAAPRPSPFSRKGRVR